eukprot:scaffold27675_cov85-Phaeocystis_antarctica.AAC.3
MTDEDCPRRSVSDLRRLEGQGSGPARRKATRAKNLHASDDDLGQNGGGTGGARVTKEVGFDVQCMLSRVPMLAACPVSFAQRK